MQRIIKYLDLVIYWSIVFMPFSISIAQGFISACMGLMIVGFLLKKILKRESLFINTAINIPLLLLFLVTCLSAFNSPYLKDTFKGGMLKLLQYIFVFFIVATELRDINHIKKIIFSTISGLILASVDGIWQVLIGHDFIRGYDPVAFIGLLRATASFKDPNTFGIYLSAIAPLLFALTLYPGATKPCADEGGVNLPSQSGPRTSSQEGLHYFKGIRKVIFVFLSFIALVAIVLPYSRPTLLAVYVALFLLGLARKNKVLINLLIIFVLVSPFFLTKSVKDFAKQVNYNPVRFMCNDDRIAIFINSLNMIKSHPIIGLGANTYMKNYKKYKGYPEYRNVVTSDYCYAHNNFLHMTAEIGLLGLLIFIWLLYKLLKQSWHIYKSLNDQFLKIVSLSLFCCLIAFLINGLTESSLYSSRVATIFWYIAGFALALNKFTYADRPKKS